ncbi:hypothetical protein H6F76_25530 [Leptolyngbya sp. FACHB-321]|uniref:hypothetical protein n=1 Tax=Leptolyngbya sp. FACHB-321 TaxID=2692807 RepID=UPI0016892273|nr:hypothetical protein [Leptolyngbya sp. FACHB-321]MBD2038319.1 hypothetical protein [Leptolyngbya sp. FACHB-321]
MKSVKTLKNVRLAATKAYPRHLLKDSPNGNDRVLYDRQSPVLFLNLFLKRLADRSLKR